MKLWAETEIGLVFFTGLLLALITGAFVLFYLSPFKIPINKITGSVSKIWSRSFVTTILLAGLIGALSVSFRDCGGDYDYLLKSKKEIVMKGMQQVSTSFEYLSWTMSFWLVVFLVMFILIAKKNLKTADKESGK